MKFQKADVAMWVCFFILGFLVCIIISEPLFWSDSEIYKEILDYEKNDYYYIENEHDCSEISVEIAERLQNIGYDAKSISVIKKEQLNGNTPIAHAIVEVPIWIDISGNLLVPNETYVRYWGRTK